MFSILHIDDIDENYVNILSTLTIISKEDIPNMKKAYSKIKNNPLIQIWVYKNDKGNVLMTGTLIIEQKLYRNCQKVGHIEDICVSIHEQGKGLGKIMINHLKEIAKQNDCYKIILDCSMNVKPFYEKSGFDSKNIQMSLYF